MKTLKEISADLQLTRAKIDELGRFL